VWIIVLKGEVVDESVEREVVGVVVGREGFVVGESGQGEKRV